MSSNRGRPFGTGSNSRHLCIHPLPLPARHEAPTRGSPALPVALVVTVLLALAAPRGKVLADAAVPPMLRAAALLRVLAYERGFAEAEGDAELLVFGADADADVMAQTFAQVSLRFRVSSRRVHVRRLSGDARALERRAPGAAAIYVTATELQKPSVRRVLRAARLPVLCEGPAQLSHGCALSLEPTAGGSRLVVNLRAGSRAGLRFDARVLRSARLLR